MLSFRKASNLGPHCLQFWKFPITKVIILCHSHLTYHRLSKAHSSSAVGSCCLMVLSDDLLSFIEHSGSSCFPFCSLSSELNFSYTISCRFFLLQNGVGCGYRFFFSLLLLLLSLLLLWLLQLFFVLPGLPRGLPLWLQLLLWSLPWWKKPLISLCSE